MIGTVMARTPFGGKYESQASVQTLGGGIIIGSSENPLRSLKIHSGTVNKVNFTVDDARDSE
jgi:hypothetical protein